jgi:hypothetical protein
MKRWEGNVACMGDKRGANRVFVGRAQEKRPLGRPGRRWRNNMKMGLPKSGMEWHGVD